MATMQLDIGGAETHIVELSKALHRRGIEVFVVSNGGAYEKELIDAGIMHFKVPLQNKSLLNMYFSYKELERIILDNKIDVVHAHARIPGFICGLLQKKHHFRFVTTAHWVFKTEFPFNLLSNWGDRSLAVSDDIKQYLIDNYKCMADNIRVTINGIDTQKFSKDIDYSDVCEEFALAPDKTRIVYVSRMDEDRSFAAHKLIEIAENIDRKIKNLEIVIVGGGNDFENIKAEAEQVNNSLGKRLIVTTGSRTDINKFVASGRIFIGVSRAALEAMSCEKPSIIAGNEGYIGIFDEDKLKISIDTNFCCRGCEMTTAEKLEKDVLTLLEGDSDSVCERLGKYSREIIKTHYSVETMADDALKMYISEIKGSKINEVSLDELNDIEKYNLHRIGKRKTDVMLSGYYGFKNNGDDSILEAIIKALRDRCPEIKITVLSKTPEATSKEYGVTAINRINVFKIWHKLKDTRLLISGGGSLMQDVTSTKSLTYYLAVIRMARMRKAKVMLYANGIGPINKKRNNARVARVLEKVDEITLRELTSKTELNRLGVEKPDIKVTADPVFLLEPKSESSINCDEKYFIISVRDWKTLDENFVKEIAGFADYICTTYGLMPVIIPMQPTKDTKVSEKISEMLCCKKLLVKRALEPTDMMYLVGKAEFVLGMRLHALIYAAKMGVPVIGLIYDPKVKAMMEYMGQELYVDVEDVDSNKLRMFADKIMENKDEIKKELIRLSHDSAEKARENAKCAIELIRGGK